MKNKDKQLLKNTIWYGVIPKVTSIINLLLLPIITPYLTKNDYGIIGLINSYTSICVSICALGLHMHLTNSFFEYKTKYKLIWRRLFALILAFSVILSVIQIVIFIFALPDTSPHSRALVMILSVFPIIFYGNQLIANNYYVLAEKPEPLVTRNLIAGIAGIVITYLGVTYFKLGYLSWLISSAVSAVILFLLFVRPLYLKEKIYPHLPRFDSRIKNYLWIAIPIIPHNLGHTLLTSSDRIVMSALNIDLSEIGLFTNGYQMGEYASFLITGIFVALSPALQKAFRSNDQKTMLYYFRLSFITIFTFIIILSLWMHVVYKVLVRNDSLQSAYNIAIVIVFSFMFFNVYSYMSLPVLIKKKTQHILWLVFVPGVLNVVLNIILIPIFGYKCVAFTTLVAYWTVPLISFWHSFYRNEMIDMIGKTYLKEVAIMMTAGLISFLLIIFFFKTLSFYVLIPLTLIICLLYFFTYKRLAKQNA